MALKTSRGLAVGFLLTLGLPGTAAAEEWIEGTPMPEADAQRLAVDGGDGNIYLFGGRSEDTAVHAYDVDADTFTALEDLPHGASAPCGALLSDGRIAVFGGFDNTASTYVDELQLYDPATDSWEAGAAEEGAWACAAVATADGRLHVFGGLNGQRWYRIWDASGDGWEDGPMLPDALRRYGHGAALLDDGRFMLFGGRWSEDTTAIFDPDLGMWSEGPAMPGERMFYAFVSDGDFAYVLGGSDNGVNDMAPYYDAIWQYDFDNETWDTDFGTLATAVRESTGAIVGGEIHIFGGSNGGLLDSHQLFGEPVAGGTTTSGTGGDSSTGGTDTGDGTTSFGLTTGGGATTGIGDDGTGSGDDGSGSGSDGGGDGPSEESGDGGDETGNTSPEEPSGSGSEDGCGCRSTGAGGSPLFLLGLLFAIRGRRARR